MSDELKTRFERAAAGVQSLSSRPGDSDLLDLYSLYKQSTSGDVQCSRPGFLDFAGRAKYDAWAKLKGMSDEESMTAYIEKVDVLNT